MIVLNDTTLIELHEQARQQGETIEQPASFGDRFNLASSLGTGTTHRLDLRHGITIEIRNGILLQSIHHYRQHESAFPLTAKFYLSGGSRVRTLDAREIEPDYEELQGYNYLYHLPDLSEVEEWPAELSLQVVTISAGPAYFKTLNFEEGNFPQPLQGLLAGDTRQRFHQPLGKIAPAMGQVLQQLLCCPYQGAMQQLYLESKAIELFALQFAHWAECRQRSATAVNLRPEDIERLHCARDILLDNALHPPSLLDIAKQVGLNDYKLKRGFRQLFGTSVFSYLYDYRMQQAQQLLLDSNLSIAGVAAKVGYRNPEAFSTAFRRKFAISPKAYQLGKSLKG
ncbi:MAG: AraC family transcriptional regulator [Cyanobacteria bacterium P01_E01_bin.42]